MKITDSYYKNGFTRVDLEHAAKYAGTLVGVNGGWIYYDPNGKEFYCNSIVDTLKDAMQLVQVYIEQEGF